MLNDVFFVDSAYGWAAGTGVWKTTDGGATWRRIPLLAGTTLRRIVFADRNRGWAWGTTSHSPHRGRRRDLAASLRRRLGSTVLEYQPPDDLWSGGTPAEGMLETMATGLTPPMAA